MSPHHESPMKNSGVRITAILLLLLGLSLAIPKQAVAQQQGLVARVQALEAAVATLQSQVAGLHTALAAETAARQAADVALQNAIDAETAARQAADAALQAAIAASGGAGVSGWEVVLATSPSNSDPWKELVAECPAGKKVLGGGGIHWIDVFSHGWPDDHFHISVDSSFPAWWVDGWVFRAHEDPQPPIHATGGTGASWKIQTFAICANVAP